MKRTRKLIPAFAMLLVSAIMLSTASFAWFTTNEAVTASGMQVQAKATGSLVISNKPLTYASTTTEADLATAITQLKPIHLTTDGDWQLPGKPEDVNSITGMLGKDDALATIDDSKVSTEYYFDNVVYVGSAGDPLDDQTFTVKLSAPVIATGTETVTKAYSAAIYVMGVVSGEADTLDMPAVGAKPDAIVNVDELDGRNVFEITAKQVDIPSIVGVGDQNKNVTGVKIVIRVFVDGDLEADEDEKVPVPDGTYTYAKPTNKTFSKNAQYFVEAYDDKGNRLKDDLGEDAFKPAVIPDEYLGENPTNTTIPDDWYTRTADTVGQNYKYVNSKNVPTAASSLSVVFSID